MSVHFPVVWHDGQRDLKRLDKYDADTHKAS